MNINRIHRTILGLLTGLLLALVILAYVLISPRAQAIGALRQRTLTFQSQQQVQPNKTITGTYVGTVSISDPVALGILDLTVHVTSVNGLISGEVDTKDNMAFSGVITITGMVIQSIGTITSTFTIDSSKFTSSISGRTVQRSFRLEGEVRNGGEILAGTYAEAIEGFTPKPLVVGGTFLLSRIESISAVSEPVIEAPTTP